MFFFIATIVAIVALILKIPAISANGKPYQIRVTNLWNECFPRMYSMRFFKHNVLNVVAPDRLEPLFDNFSRRHNYLRISLTEKCNLRSEYTQICRIMLNIAAENNTRWTTNIAGQYCMPAEGVSLSKREDLLTSDEVVHLAQLFAQLGVDKIRLTGGEPTVRRDLVSLLQRLKEVPGIETVAMTTNGLTLTRQLVALQRAGLGVLNISLDTLQPPRYQQMARRQGFERVIAGIDLAIQLNYRPKINCVVMKNFNMDELCDFVEFTKDRNVDVRFIEFMPFTGNKWDNENLVSYKQMLDTILSRWPAFTSLDNQPHDTSKAWQVPGYAGQVGFITSMTEHFCASCNRLRITADGNLKVCLFGASEVSLRDALRSGANTQQLVDLIRTALSKKKKQHAGSTASKMKAAFRIPVYTKVGNLVFLPSDLNQSRVRFYSDSKEFSHLDSEGNARMVDVGHKDVTQRKAIASATVWVGSHICKLISEGRMKKGNVLNVAQLAGILAAKKTPDLIPLCHNITLDSVNVTLILGESNIVVRCEANCQSRTGVEMEALTGATVAALTVYDMCKSVSKTIRITDIHLVQKKGGKSDLNLKYNTEPINPSETYAPVNFMYL